MHYILSEHCLPNTVEHDKSILGNYNFTTTAHFLFQCESIQFNLMALWFFFNSQKRTVTSDDNE